MEGCAFAWSALLYNKHELDFQFLDHAIEVVSPSFQRIPESKKETREEKRSVPVASPFPDYLLSFVVSFAPSAFLRRSDAAAFWSGDGNMTYGRSLRPRFPEIPSGYTGCISLTVHGYSCSPPTLLCASYVQRRIFSQEKRTDGRLDGENYKRVEGSRKDA